MIKCYSVRLKSLEPITDKAFKAVAFDGSEAILPASQVMGPDFGVDKSDAYWISAWILGKKELQYSSKKVAWFNESGKMVPNYVVMTHKPERVEPINVDTIKELER